MFFTSTPSETTYFVKGLKGFISTPIAENCITVMSVKCVNTMILQLLLEIRTLTSAFIINNTINTMQTQFIYEIQ